MIRTESPCLGGKLINHYRYRGYSEDEAIKQWSEQPRHEGEKVIYCRRYENGTGN
jgi:hypothetical protein